MCFSATASFTASLLLTCMGIITLYKTHKKNYYAFAAIPLIFGIQQFCEGMLWYFLSHTNTISLFISSLMTYLFLFFAFILWPIWIPLSVALIEKKDPCKDLIAIPLAIGLTFGLSMLTHLIYFGARAYVLNHHIVYDVYLPESFWVPGTIGYLIAIIVPFFCTGNWKMILFGIGLIASYVISFYFYYKALISIWCFFAALLSFGIFLLV